MRYTRKNRFFGILLVAVFFGVIISLLGGFKLMIYLMLLVTGLLIGWNAYRIKGVVADYRLALRVNTIQFSAKQTEGLKEKIKDLESELKSAQTRLNLSKGDQA